MKKWIADNPWQFAIISNLLSAIIGAALSITLDLVKFFPSQYDQMMREVTQAHLNVQREKHCHWCIKQNFHKFVNHGLKIVAKVCSLFLQPCNAAVNQVD